MLNENRSALATVTGRCNWFRWDLALGDRALMATAPPALAAALLLTAAGAALAYGPALESCATDGLAVNPNGGWQRRLEDARPGSTILMRGGSYTLRGRLKLPSGTAQHAIVIKPYDCERVMLTASAESAGRGHVLEPGSFVTLAGLFVESATHESLVRIRSGRQNFVLRNNSLVGGRNDAFVISGGESILVEGNYINSGPGQHPGITTSSGGHIFYLKSDDSGGGPSDVRIVGNQIEGSYFGDLVSGDDVFAVQAGDGIVIEGNRITNQFNIENIIDIKTRGSSSPVIFRDNYASDNFKGSKGGQDHGRPEPCIVIGDADRSPPLRHRIEGNVFDGCPGGALSVGGGKRTGSALIVDNLFRERSGDGSPASGVIARSVDTEIAHNVFYRGALTIARPGSGCGSAQMPAGLRIRDNVFYQTRIVDQTDDCPTIDYLLARNIFYNLPQGFERGRRQGNLNADPRFRNAASGDFSLLPDSPAIGAGSDGRAIGRLSGRSPP